MNSIAIQIFVVLLRCLARLVIIRQQLCNYCAFNYMTTNIPCGNIFVPLMFRRRFLRSKSDGDMSGGKIALEKFPLQIKLRPIRTLAAADKIL